MKNLFIGAFVSNVLGIVADKRTILLPLGFFFLTFSTAFILGLVAKSKKAIEDLQERVSELEKR